MHGVMLFVGVLVLFGIGNYLIDRYLLKHGWARVGSDGYVWVEPVAPDAAPGWPLVLVHILVVILFVVVVA